MIERYHFPKCYLNIGQHKTIDSSVHLEICTHTDDEYAESQPEEDSDEVRGTGELSFDAYRSCDLPVYKNTVAQLTLNDGDEYSKCNILLAEKNDEQVVIKERIKKHFWLFFVVGRPIYDALEIFPKWYRGKAVNKIFTCTDFRGIWPIGVSSIVVAKDKREARYLLLNALESAGINQPEIRDLTLQEIDLAHPQVFLLNSGAY